MYNDSITHYYIKTFESHKKAIFNAFDSERHDSFVFDFDYDQKIKLTPNAKNHIILDISPDARFVLFTTNTAREKEKILYMKDLETNEIVFQINEFFTYEARFTPSKSLLLCRGSVNRNQKLFVYNLLDKKIAYVFPQPTPIEYGCFNFEENTFVIPEPDKKSTLFTFDFTKLSFFTTTFDETSSIKKIVHYKGNAYVVVDNKLVCTMYKGDTQKWNTKIEIPKDSGLPAFFVMKSIDKILLNMLAQPSKTSNHLSSNYQNILILNTRDGLINSVALPSNSEFTDFTDVVPFYGSSVIDTTGKIFDMKTKKYKQFPLEYYRN